MAPYGTENKTANDSRVVSDQTYEKQVKSPIFYIHYTAIQLSLI